MLSGEPKRFINLNRLYIADFGSRMEHPPVEETYRSIEDDRKKLFELWVARFRENPAIYDLDVVCIGLTDRAISLSESFVSLHKDRKYTGAMAILRSQIDTLLRAFGLYLVPDINVACSRIMSGERFDRLKDKDGNKLRDWFLKDSISIHYPWVKTVYERSSGFVHFSRANVTIPFGDIDENGSSQMTIGAGGATLPDELFEESAAAFLHVQILIYDYISRLPNFSSR